MNKQHALQGKTRVQYIDWLRIIAVLLLFPFHTNEVFSHSYFYYVKNADHSVVAAYINTFMYQWHMPLFMFLSGIGSYYALKFRSAKEYTLERLKRLFIPLIFGIIVLVPPLAYIRCFGRPELTWPQGLSHLAPGSGFNLSFLEFYPEFFTNGIFPFGYLEWSHLWFLAYLFTFSLIALPLFLFLKTERGSEIINSIVGISKKRFGIFLLFIPIAIIEVSLRWKFPGLQNLVADWANFLTYTTLFIYGFLLMSHQSFMDAVGRHWKGALICGILMNTVITTLYMTGIKPGEGDVLFYATLMVFRAFNMWCWMIGLLGLGKRFLNSEIKFLSYGREAALPFYILHQLAIVIIGFFVVSLSLSAGVKYIIIISTSFITCVIIYEVLVKRFNVFRFFFGLKVKGK